MDTVIINTKEDLLNFLAVSNKPTLRDSLLILSNIELLDNLDELNETQMITFGYAIGEVLEMPTMMSVKKECLRKVIELFWKDTFELEVE
jgi:hypothetical protein